VTDDTAAFALFYAVGGGLIPDGTYLCDPLDISVQVHIICRGTLKLRTAVGGVTAKLVNFASGSEGSVWEGGAFDGNIALHPLWVYAGGFSDWQAVNIDVARITLRGCTFTNWTNHPLVAGGDYAVVEDIEFINCATGPLFGWDFETGATRPNGSGGVGQTVRGVKLIGVGDIGVAGTLQHNIRVYKCKGSSFSNITISKPTGTNLGRSIAILGLVDRGSENCSFSDVLYEDPIGEDLQHLAFSFVGTESSTISNLKASNFAGLGLELLDVTDSVISNVVIDGLYRTTTYTPTNTKGVSIDRGEWLSTGSSARGISGTNNNTLTNVIVQRVNLGYDIKAGPNTLSNCRAIGCNAQGIVLAQATAAQFPGSSALLNTGIALEGCVSEFNGGGGLSIATDGGVTVSGGSYSNNGQDTLNASTARSGIVGTTAGRLTVTGAKLADRQSFSVVDGISFAPITTAGNTATVFATIPNAYTVGQMITLVAAGSGSADLTGKVVDVNNEALTLDFGTTVTLISTGLTAALAGTWSGSNVFLTGIGTAAISEIVGPLYVTNGAEWRRVTRVISDTSIVIDSPFSASLSGTTLTKLSATVNGIPSQQYGARIFNGVVRCLLKGNEAPGNVLERSTISNLTRLEPGSEYWRKTTTAITGSGSTVDLLTGFYNGHRLAGWTALNAAAISGGGATSLSYNFTDSGGATKESLATGLSLSLNQNPRGNAAGTIVETNDKIVVTFAGGTPTTGSIVFEAFIKCDLPELLPTV